MLNCTYINSIMTIGEDFVGNKKAVDHLDRLLQKGVFSHAYIFDGPESVGKTKLALAFAASLLEDSVDSVLNNPDLIFIEPEKGKQEIVADDIRSLQKGLSLYPYKSKWKIALVDKAHLMNLTAANSILKILEEPNQTSILILVSSDFSKMLDTIKSRCSIVSFGLVGDEEIRNKMLCGVKDSDLILSLALNRPGVAVALMNDLHRIELMDGFVKGFSCTSGSFDRIKEAERLSGLEFEDLVDVLGVFIAGLRKKLLSAMQDERGSLNMVQDIKKRIDIINKTKFDICNNNVNIKLAIENLYLNT